MWDSGLTWIEHVFSSTIFAMNIMNGPVMIWKASTKTYTIARYIERGLSIYCESKKKRSTQSAGFDFILYLLVTLGGVCKSFVYIMDLFQCLFI